MIAALLLAFSLPVRAQPPEAVVARVLARAEKLVAAQKGKDAREIFDLDREAEGLSKELKPLGWKAVPALAAAAKDLKRPAKVRLLAVSFLGLTADPSALPPLSEVLLDPEQPAFVRSLAAQSLPGLGAHDAPVRTTLCLALAQEDLPREVLAESLIPLKRLGCPDAAALTRIARSFGPHPGEKDLLVVSAALAVMSKSLGPDSGKAILALVSYFPARGPARAAAIAALDVRRADVSNWLKPETLPVVIEALRSESAQWETMIPLVRLAAALGPEAEPALARLTKHPDAEVLAEVAEALAAAKHLESIPALDAVIAGAMNDPRFSPKEGRPDPAVSLARIEKAVAALRRAR